MSSKEMVNHPQHYGGKDNPYEAIKVIDAWELDFCLGNTVKYIARNGKKGSDTAIQDLKKAAWYLNHKIEMLESLCQKLKDTHDEIVANTEKNAQLLVEQILKMRIACFDLEEIIKKRGIQRDRYIIAIGESVIYVYFKDNIQDFNWFPLNVNGISTYWRNNVGETVALEKGFMEHE